jgi:hypothetical protein
MSRILRTVVVLCLAMLGVYYAVLGTTTLLNLTDVTWRWIQLSGDSDFRFDFNPFMTAIGLGALGVSLLGLGTTVCGMSSAAGRPVSSVYWGALAVAALFVHAPWFLYRIVATGRMSRSDATAGIQAVAIRFAVVCLAYALAWALTRRDSAGRIAALDL